MAKSKRSQRPAARKPGAPQGAGTTQHQNGRSSTTPTARATQNNASPRQNGKTGNTSTAGAASAQPARLASIRERAPRARQPRRRYARTPWWKGVWGAVSLGVGVLVIIAIIVGVAYYQSQRSAAGIGSPVPASVMHEVTNVNTSVFSTVGAGPNPNPLIALPLATPPLTANGRPEILYIGGDFCPYCAALRWSLVVALSRFGTFSNLRLMKSSHTDSYADTNTFTFSQSTYTSAYIVFVPREIYDRNNAPQQTLTSQQQQLFSKYDNAPYSQAPATSIPFVYFAGHYMLVGAPFDPASLQGLSWQQIAAGLGDPTNAATKDIIGIANQITAAVCLLDNQQPGAVCQAPTIQTLEKKMPARK